MRLLISISFLFSSVTMETSTDISLNNVVSLVGQKFEYLVGDDKFREEYEIYKIVERGSKKLPDWLSFDRNTSLLVGVPLEKDVGIHNMRMRACMIEKTNTDCQNKISKSFQIDVVEPLRTEAERGSHLVPVHAGNGNRMRNHGISGTYSSSVHVVKTPKGSLSALFEEGSFSALHEVNYIKDNVYYRHCEFGEITFYASLVLHVESNMNNLEKVFLLDCMSNFLSKDVNAFSLSQYNPSILSLTNKHIISAGPGNVIESLSNSMELSWHVACGKFKHVSDFSKVLQHNIDSGRLTAELGFGIIAWYIFADRRVPNRVKRNGARQTATPSLTQPVPTKMSDLTEFTMLTSISSTLNMDSLSPYTSTSSTVFAAPSAVLTPSASSFPKYSMPSSSHFALVISPSIVSVPVSFVSVSQNFYTPDSTHVIASTDQISDIRPSFTSLQTFVSLPSTSSLSSGSLSTSEVETGVTYPLTPSPLPTASVISLLSLSATSLTEIFSFKNVSESALRPSSVFTSLLYSSLSGHSHILTPSGPFSHLSITSSSTVEHEGLASETSLLISSISHTVSRLYFASLTLVSFPNLSSKLEETSLTTSSLNKEFSTVAFVSLLETVFTADETLPAFVSSPFVTSYTLSLSQVSVVSDTEMSKSFQSISYSSFKSLSLSSSVEISDALTAVPPFSYFMPSVLADSVSSLSAYKSSHQSSILASSPFASSKPISVSSAYISIYLSPSTTVKFLEDSAISSVAAVTFTSFSYISSTSTFTATSRVSAVDNIFSSQYLGTTSSVLHTVKMTSFINSSLMDKQSFSRISSSDFLKFENATPVQNSSGMTTLESLTNTVYSYASVFSSELTSILFIGTTLHTTEIYSSDDQTFSLVTSMLSIYPSISATANLSLLLSASDAVFPSRILQTNLTELASSDSLISSPYFPASSSEAVTMSNSVTSSASEFAMNISSTSYLIAISTESYSSFIRHSISSFISLTYSHHVITSTSSETVLPGSSFHIISSLFEPSSATFNLPDTPISSKLSSSTPHTSTTGTSMTVSLLSFPVAVTSILPTFMHSPFRPTSSSSLGSLHSVTTVSTLSPTSVSIISISSTATTKLEYYTVLSIDTAVLSLTPTPVLPLGSSLIESYSSVTKTLQLSYHSSVTRTELHTNSLSLTDTLSGLTAYVSPVLASVSSSVAVTTSVTSTSKYTSSSTMMTTTAIPDRSPVLQNPINQLEVHVGKYYEYRIPAGTFNDTEDGDTRNLSLSVTLVYGKPLPKRAWIMFNETSQTIYGFPLWQDIIDEKKDRIMTIILTAKDSAGQIEKDAIRLIYNKSHVMGHSHKIDLGFSGNFKDFMKSRNNLISVARDITSFYGDSNLEFLTVLETRSGSLNVVWSNSSLAGEACDRRKIQNLFDKLVDANGTIKEEFEDLFSNSPRNSSLADVNITSAKLEFVGDCLLPVTTTAVPPVTNSPASSTDDNDKIWIEVVIPALVAILLLVIVALILLICCRHRRSRKKLSKSEKPMFLEDRRPIIFPEELEMTDPNLKPKSPLVLPSDLMSDTPPPVPPHRNRDVPQYQVAAMDDDVFVSDSRSPPPPQLEGSQTSDPPPYRLPPPYFNPHRSNR